MMIQTHMIIQHQVNAPYGEYYDQNMYGNYDQYGQPPAAATTTAAASAHPPSTSSSSSKGKFLIIF